MVTPAGVNFMALSLVYKAPSTYWASGAVNSVFFQVEEPLPALEPAARLLQETVTGNGIYEGMLINMKLLSTSATSVNYFGLFDMQGDKKLVATDK